MKYLFLTLTTVILLAGCVSSEAGFPHTAYTDLLAKVEEIGGGKAPMQVKISTRVNAIDWDGFDMVPIVLIGSDTIPLNNAWYPQEFDYYKDSINYHLGDTVEVRIVYNDGEIKGSLGIPDTFKITAPASDTGIVSKNSSYTTAWNTSKGADWYNVDFYLHYEYYDTLGFHSVYIDTSFPTKSTSYTFPANYLFPQNVDSVSWSYGHFSVSAYSGPMMWPGEMLNNMNGKGKGYYTAETSDPRNYKRLRVEGSSYKAQEIPTESSYEHTKKTIEMMKKLSGANLPSISGR